ncbi:MAG: hypothetical protein ABJH82_08855 [Polaribacter sp.]|uniref:hypothetical protein n=1 Tax=Polaribacter sp. TaxID=1920175 RepID=UPI0032634AC3
MYQLDEISVLTWSIIIAIALLQQSIGLLIEFGLYLIASKKNQKPLSNFYLLFFKRFKLANKNKITDYASGVIGNLFLSINIFVGLIFLLIYFLLFENLPINHWVLYFLVFFLLATFVNIIFRIQTAKKVIIN